MTTNPIKEWGHSNLMRGLGCRGRSAAGGPSNTYWREKSLRIPMLIRMINRSKTVQAVYIFTQRLSSFWQSKESGHVHLRIMERNGYEFVLESDESIVVCTFFANCCEMSSAMRIVLSQNDIK